MGQTALAQNETEKQMNPDEMRKYMEAQKNYFKVEPGKEYTLTIKSGWFGVEKTQVYDVNKQPIPGKFAERQACHLNLDTLNGEPIEKIWTSNSTQVIKFFLKYFEMGQLEKWAYTVSKSGEGMMTKYAFFVQERKQGGATASSSSSFLQRFPNTNPELAKAMENREQIPSTFTLNAEIQQSKTETKTITPTTLVEGVQANYKIDAGTQAAYDSLASQGPEYLKAGENTQLVTVTSLPNGADEQDITEMDGSAIKIHIGQNRVSKELAATMIARGYAK